MKEIYFKDYDHKARWMSYYYQINETKKLKPENILEIGMGNGTVTDYLRKRYKITTLDVEKELNPDVLADVRKMPFKDKEFDVALCCEVLEHLPFEEFSKALGEIKRVAKNVIISLPDHRRTILNLSVKIPFLKKFGIFIKIPSFQTHKFDGHHYWEIGKKGFPPKRIIDEIKKSGLEVKKHFVPSNAPVNHYFVLK